MRLKELEKRIDRIKPRDLILLCRMPDGTEKEMGLDEYVGSNCDFIRLISGNNLDQVDRLLRGISESVIE